METQSKEIEQWQKRAESEEEMRRQADITINNLQRTIEEAQKDIGKLGVNVQEWRLLAEHC